MLKSELFVAIVMIAIGTVLVGTSVIFVLWVAGKVL